MLKDLIVRIRRLFTSAVPASAVATYHRHPPGLVYARANPETVSIVETYSYQQEISRNRETQADPSRPPTGRVRITVPYDGDHYLTRQAGSDIAGQVPPDNTEPTEALVGHVVLTGYGKADLGYHTGDVTALPIRVPVSGGGLPRGYDHLIGDRASCVLTHDYRPDPGQPEIFPVTVSITLIDPDSDDLLEIARLSDVAPDVLRARLSVLRSFQPYLLLRVKVAVHVAGGSADLRPEVSLVSITWPKLTSLSSFGLRVSGKDFPIRYNPDRQSLEWRDVPLTATRKKEGAKQATDRDVPDEQPEPERQQDDEQEPAIRTYESPAMTLFVQQPGELYREPMLRARVDVRIPRLLSGMAARLYAGTGVLATDCEPELVSEVSTDVTMILDDAFADRYVSTSQHLHIEEVLPDPARIEDIRNALAGHGFQCVSDEQVSDDPYQHLLVYRRSEGPDAMELGYLVEGRRFPTSREKVVGGETYTTPVQSGDLKIFGYGTLKTSSREVTRAMNELQKILRPQFSHVRVRR
jgi:hypothetical protein